MALLLAPELERELNQKIDVGHTIKIILVHDLAEIHAGDHHAFKDKPQGRHQQEEAGLKRLLEGLPQTRRGEILSLWQEYETAETIEGKFAKALDKMEVLIQHTEADIKTWTPRELGYNFLEKPPGPYEA